MSINAKRIKFGFNKQKATEAILFFANKDKAISKMRLLKFVFFADLYHLKKYGRPILGDRYVAMQKGPVLSKLYDMIRLSSRDFQINHNAIIPLREADLTELSQSDIEAFSYAYNQYSQYSTNNLRDLTHEEGCWQKARNREPESNNPDIFWEEMIDNEEVLDNLREYSRFMLF